jgi:predicted esterase
MSPNSKCMLTSLLSLQVYRGNFDAELKNPLLLIAETYDPATPLRNGRRLAQALGKDNARLSQSLASTL